MVIKVQNCHKVGIVGFGKMGSAFAERLGAGGYQVIVYDAFVDARRAAMEHGFVVAQSLQELVQAVQVIFLLVPAGKVVDTVINELLLYSIGHIIIDAGNSYFKDSIRRALMVHEHKNFFLDCGTSGGIRGKESGFCLMIGGMRDAFDAVQEMLKVLAAVDGYGYIGESGSGHYAKMIHNGIEYALLQGYAEGFNLLQNGVFKDIDCARVAGLWNQGSIIRSFILELLEEIFSETKDFSSLSGVVDHTGMGQWTVDTAYDSHIDVQLIRDALEIRKKSAQTGGDFSTQLVALLRHKFGGHPVGTVNNKSQK